MGALVSVWRGPQDECEQAGTAASGSDLWGLYMSPRVGGPGSVLTRLSYG